MPPVHPKLRTALLIFFASCSLFCAVLMVGSFVWAAEFYWPKNYQINPVNGRVLVVNSEYPAHIVYEVVLSPTDFPANIRRWKTWRHLLHPEHYELRVYNVSILSVPLWIPTIGFGAWPATVAIKAALRRRRLGHGRGFEVTAASEARTADRAPQGS